MPSGCYGEGIVDQANKAHLRSVIDYPSITTDVNDGSDGRKSEMYESEKHSALTDADHLRPLNRHLTTLDVASNPECSHDSAPDSVAACSAKQLQEAVSVPVTCMVPVRWVQESSSDALPLSAGHEEGIVLQHRRSDAASIAFTRLKGTASGTFNCRKEGILRNCTSGVQRGGRCSDKGRGGGFIVGDGDMKVVDTRINKGLKEDDAWRLQIGTGMCSWECTKQARRSSSIKRRKCMDDRFQRRVNGDYWEDEPASQGQEYHKPCGSHSTTSSTIVMPDSKSMVVFDGASPATLSNSEEGVRKRKRVRSAKAVEHLCTVEE